MRRTYFTFALLAALLLARGAGATLINQGNGLIDDTVLNITWVQNANLCVTLDFPHTSGNAKGLSSGV